MTISNQKKNKKLAPGFLAITGMAVLLSTSALADVKAIKEMPNGGNVTLSGTVDKVNNERKFVLRDGSGTVDVEIKSGQSLMLRQGENVTVTGTVDKGVLGTTINANNVEGSKGVVEATKKALDTVTDGATNAAPTVAIKNLPETGAVRVTGVVEDVSSDKKFTLRDQTGTVNVEVKSGESAVVTKGAEVTVVGNVSSGVLGKDINATNVIIRADAGNTAAKPN
jgi:uncharacterized protein YdeI (BOF family)